MRRIEKFLSGISTDKTEEIVEKLFCGNGGFRCERIISYGQCSRADFWYEQDEDEFVFLVFGNAALRFDDGIENMSNGDFLIIPKGTRHRVEEVSIDAVWLVFFGDFSK